MYSQARQGLNNINCSKDPTPSCVCKGTNINFWYGLQDCTQQGCGQDVFKQVAKWKDNVLCAKPRGPTRTTATVAPPTTKPTTTTSTSTGGTTSSCGILYVSDGVTKCLGTGEQATSAL
jgi:hypothetical protein